MNKKIILGLAATALLSSSLLAFNGQCQMQQRNNAGNMHGKMMKGEQGRDGHMFMKMVMKLDLSNEQRTQIMAIVKKSMQSMPNPHDAFTDTSFDKKEFIKLANERRDAKIETRADMIEKIYAVLDASQKKDLKTMLDMKDIMRKNMGKGMNCNAKNCNGGR